jgi:hypothetical protein
MMPDDDKAPSPADLLKLTEATRRGQEEHAREIYHHVLHHHFLKASKKGGSSCGLDYAYDEANSRYDITEWAPRPSGGRVWIEHYEFQYFKKILRSTPGYRVRKVYVSTGQRLEISWEKERQCCAIV